MAFLEVTLFQILVAYLVYRSTQSRNMNYKPLWMLLVFLFPLCGALIYWLFKGPKYNEIDG